MIQGQTPQPAAQPFPANPPPQGNGPPPVTIDAVVQLLRNERMRGFRIDVETDSMIEADQAKEKQNATELVTALGGFFKEFGPIVQAMPPLAPLASGLLQFAVRRYRVGQELEELIEKTMGDVAQRLNNPPPPQPSPDEMAKLQGIQMKAQAEGQKAQMDVAAAAQKAQNDQQSAQIDMAGKVMDHQLKREEHGMKLEQATVHNALEAQALQNQAEAEQHGHDLKLEQMDHAAKVAKQKPKGD